jgi:hypothetical protein
MFRTVFASIIRSSRLHIQQQAYVKQLLQFAASGDDMEFKSSISSPLAAGSSSSVSRSSRLHISKRWNSWVPSRPRWQQVAAALWRMPVAVCVVSSSWWWTERSSETCRVLCKALHSIMRILKKGNNNKKRLAYTALVRPILEYGAVCWDHTALVRPILQYGAVCWDPYGISETDTSVWSGVLGPIRH